MAEYIENVLNQTSKLDWAFPFERKGQFPIDRSALFSSLADAQAYAVGDGSDERKLGGTSYVGQIISVYEASNEPAEPGEEGSVSQVNAYIITPARSLMKLASTTASGDIAADVATLQGEVNTLISDLDTLEAEVKAMYSNEEIDTAIDNAIKAVLGDGVDEAYNTLKEIQDILQGAEGGDIKALIDSIAANKTAIEAEVARAEAAEKALGERIDAIDFVDSTELADILKAYATSADVANTYATKEALTQVSNTAADAQARVKIVEDKIDEITAEGGGEPNVLERIKVNGITQEVVDKEVNITVPTKLADLEDGERTAEQNTLGFVKGTENKVNITAGQITGISTDVLFQGTEEFVLNGGNANN